MQSAALPPNEQLRLAALDQLLGQDGRRDQRYRHIVEYAAAEFDVPICLFSLVGEHEQWFMARVGLKATCTPRDISFCAHAILQPEVLVVEDALLDPRFHDNPLVTGDPNIRFYAGAPVVVEGQALGTLCVIDTRPRSLAEEDIRVLEAVRDKLVTEISASAPSGG